MSFNHSMIRTLRSALCVAVLGWTLPAAAETDVWEVSDDESGMATQAEIKEQLSGGRTRHVQIAVTSTFTSGRATVTIDGKSRDATERETQLFWIDRGGVLAVWNHLLAAERLTVALLGEPREEDVKLPWDQMPLVPKQGKLPEKLIGKTALVTLFSDRQFVGVINAGPQETEMVLKIAGKDVTITVTAIKSVHVQPE